MKLVTIALLAVCLQAQTHTQGVQKVKSLNFSVDLQGPVDHRQATWGRADAQIIKITFPDAPPGSRVHVLRVYGDFVAWPKGKAPDGTCAGVLMSMASTRGNNGDRLACESGGTFLARCAADGTFLYKQRALCAGSPASNMDFDLDVSAGGLLEPDNIMELKVASWLNDTGLVIHMEPTFVVVYRYEAQNHLTSE